MIPNLNLTNIIPRIVLNRSLLIFIIIFYVLISDWIYLAWLYPNFAYFGYTYHKPALYLLLTTHLLAFLPAFWIPIKLKRPSIGIFWFIYLFTYIPSQLFPAYIGLNTGSELFLLSITLFISIIIISSGYFLELIEIKKLIKISNYQFDIIIYSSCFISILYLILIYGGSLKIVGTEEIYAFREENSHFAESSWAGYVIFALGSSILPIMMARGLINKKIIPILISIAGQLFLYSTQGAKSNFLAPVILFFVYIIVRKGPEYFGIKISSFITIFITLLSFIAIFIPNDPSGPLFYAISAIFLRITSIEGLLTAQYFNFFSHHPYTYYTHINIVGTLFTYPYGTTPIGKVIGYKFIGDPNVNSNAHFLATDGLAACGLYGIVLISIVCSFVFYLIDSISKNMDVKFTSIALAFIALNLLNSSLFSTLLSGGLFLSILLFYLTPENANNKIA